MINVNGCIPPSALEFEDAERVEKIAKHIQSIWATCEFFFF